MIWKMHGTISVVGIFVSAAQGTTANGCTFVSGDIFIGTNEYNLKYICADEYKGSLG
jgi:hypothetical protein